MTILRILIVEDDSVIVLTLREMLQRLGHTVLGVARNGVEAVEKTLELEPDIVIMDIEMPEFDGIEAARMINRKRPMPIVILTAYSDESLIERASRERIYSYLVKPVSEDDLRPALQLALDRFYEWQKMTDELKIAQESIENRKKIDQAKWIFVEQTDCSEEEAYQIIQRLSRDHNVKMGVVADMIIAIVDILES
jgi:AmiR/NasT family two-component response regulator